MNLYQWSFGYQPHYVVADNLKDAEETIKAEFGWFTEIKRIDNLGPYVFLSRNVVASATAASPDEKDGE